MRPTRHGSDDGSARAAESLAARLRRHAGSLERSGRSPLYVSLMRAAAGDIERGGVVAELFDSVPVPPGSVPALRLLAALHQLVLTGRAPRLAAFYPSAGGAEPPALAWPAAEETLRGRFDWVRERLAVTVQTNEPGRAAVLFAALLWLSERHRLPIRLLEVGASAGLNLLVDRFCYVIAGEALGDPGSPVRFVEPWSPAPPIDAPAAARRLRIAERGGCDVAPLDASDAEARTTLLSYIWPDELERFRRTCAALGLAAALRPPVAHAAAGAWLPDMLARTGAGELTVVWHSLVRQYAGDDEWDSLERAFAAAPSSAPIVWLGMEPGTDHVAHVELTLHTRDGRVERLAWCGDHGPPVEWVAGRDRARRPRPVRFRR